MALFICHWGAHFLSTICYIFILPKTILTQFTGKVYGTDVSGAFHGVNLSDDGLALIGRSVPEKIMFGVLNWAFHLVSDMAGSSGSIL